MTDEAILAVALADAEAADAADPLAGARERFLLPPGDDLSDGNSLGPMPRARVRGLERAGERRMGARSDSSWNDAVWFALPTPMATDRADHGRGKGRGRRLRHDVAQHLQGAAGGSGDSAGDA